MNQPRSNRIRRTAVLLALALGGGLAAPAFAGSHVSVSVGVGLPGLSVGYSDYHRAHYRHYRDHDRYRDGYVRYEAPVYYYAPPPPVVVYRRPVVVERPVYVRRGYGRPVVYRYEHERHGRHWESRDRHHDRDRYRDHDRRGGWRHDRDD